MIMKKMVAISLLTAMGIGAKAQVYVQGGLNLANISKAKDGSTNDNNILPTFNAGIMSRFGLSKVFDLEAGLLLTGKGAKAESVVDDNNYIKAKFNPIYIELPVNAVVKFPLAAEGKQNVFLHAGPYIAMGITGKTKVETKLLGIESSSKEDIKFNNDDPTTPGQEDAAYNRLKRFDYGLNFGGGVDFGALIVKANYGLGLAKINSLQEDNNDDDRSKFRTISISIGIPLGGKK